MLGRGAQSTSKSWLFPSLLVCAPITTNHCCVQPLIPRMRPPPINKGTEYEGTGLAKSPGASRLAKLRQTPACFLGCSSAQVLLVILFFLPHRRMVVRGAVVLLDGVDTGREMGRKGKKRPRPDRGARCSGTTSTWSNTISKAVGWIEKNVFLHATTNPPEKRSACRSQFISLGLQPNMVKQISLR